MKKENTKNKENIKNEDYLATRVMAVFVAAIVMLWGLSYLWNAYGVAATFFAALRANNILIGLAAVGLVGSLVWTVSDAKKGRLKKAAVLNGAMSFLFFLVLLCGALLIRFNYSSAKRVLYVVIPAIAILHLIYCSYQREFFSLCLTHSAICYGVWVIAAFGGRLALLAAVAAMCICALAVILFLKARKSDGVISLGSLRLRLFDNRNISSQAVCAIYGITALLVAAAYFLAAPYAYYILYALGVFLIIEAVYFTVKLI